MDRHLALDRVATDLENPLPHRMHVLGPCRSEARSSTTVILATSPSLTIRSASAVQLNRHILITRSAVSMDLLHTDESAALDVFTISHWFHVYVARDYVLMQPMPGRGTCANRVTILIVSSRQPVHLIAKPRHLRCANTVGRIGSPIAR